ncbi:type I-F CRISPR-associated protein Csy2 [Lampropedia aestuarii]|uniref:type I-F CRISPR-associated protein Csy2 n=1 Tax=Lampropedia aestuarii TaxID=2562762 RepID=UPI0024696246|nr:type I-F CRISPR-associated protein Csy2 [Lampropedia aestuarii]MDH5856994.1 type I-F CRISPR-associated protein Csy2 [Lampropedia aestuarii]
MTEALHSLVGKGLLVIPHLRVQNANAISSPLTHGFPSITAFLGLQWALERKLVEAGIDNLFFEKVGVVCHWHEEQVQDGFVKNFRLTRNPVDKDGSTAAIVEEGRIHLDISLVFQIGVDDTAPGNPFTLEQAERQALAWTIRELLSTMRIAGGSVIHHQPPPGQFITPWLIALDADAEKRAEQFRKLRRRLLPGFALVGRDDLLAQRLQQLQQQDAKASTLDAWLDLARFNWRSHEEPGADGKTKLVWSHDRPKDAGWLVPIPVGYSALSDVHAAGQVANARDTETPLRFVESVYSVGQWVSPHRMHSISDLLWWPDSQVERGLYRARSSYLPPAPEPDEPTVSGVPDASASASLNTAAAAAH